MSAFPPIDPHFLFNTLNSIYGRIDRKDSKARNMLLCFSEILRYQLFECYVDYIIIEKEILYLRNYIMLQQERTEEKVRVFLDIPEDIRGFLIAPLLLISIVEHAFRFVSQVAGQENKVSVSLQKKEGQLIFRSSYTSGDASPDTSRDGSPDPAVEIPCSTLSNTRRRLDLQYPGRHRLQTTDQGDLFEVLLCLNIGATVAAGRYDLS